MGADTVKEQPIGKASARRNATNWKRLRSLSDKTIEAAVEADPEAHRTDVGFWKEGKAVLPPAK